MTFTNLPSFAETTEVVAEGTYQALLKRKKHFMVTAIASEANFP
jgi:hypothetical protein